MKPGRELDALVAEKVMGLTPGRDFGSLGEHEWRRIRYNGKTEDEVDPFGFDEGDHNGPVCVKCGYGYCHHCQDQPSKPCEVHPKPYSTDIAAAWLVLEHIGNDPKFYGDRDYEVMFKKHSPVAAWCSFWLQYDEWPAPMKHVGEFKGESPAHAICLAALKAVGTL